MEITNTQMLHGLYGSQINRAKAVGYCKKHGAHLTVNTMKKHECLKKNCNHLKKHEENSYWAEREKIKEEKKIKRQIMFSGGMLCVETGRYY
jgi:hypothetical protein